MGSCASTFGTLGIARPAALPSHGLVWMYRFDATRGEAAK